MDCSSKKWNQPPIGISDRLLHVSTEKVFTEILQPLYGYISIDLDEQKAMYSMDITNLEFTAN